MINIEDYKCSVKRFDLFSAKEKNDIKRKNKKKYNTGPNSVYMESKGYFCLNIVSLVGCGYKS